MFTEKYFPTDDLSDNFSTLDTIEGRRRPPIKEQVTQVTHNFSVRSRRRRSRRRCSSAFLCSSAFALQWPSEATFQLTTSKKQHVCSNLPKKLRYVIFVIHPLSELRPLKGFCKGLKRPLICHYCIVCGIF